MMQCCYIEVTVSLVETAKMLSQAVENGVIPALPFL
jgi:hypothetical protein